jgi:DNA-binding response OmpR family regulator
VAGGVSKPVQTESRLASHETKRGWSFAGWRFAPDHDGLCAPYGRPVELTRQETRLLTVFLRAAGRTLSRDFLLDSLGETNKDVYDRAIDTVVSRLRQKLHDDARRPLFIVTRHGSGQDDGGPKGGRHRDLTSLPRPLAIWV